MKHVDAVLRGVSCLHPRMRECHRGCGHWVCPDCGLFYDDAFDGGVYRIANQRKSQRTNMKVT